MAKQKWQNLYCAVVYDPADNDSIVSSWAGYADNIREAKEVFKEEFWPGTKGNYRVIFRLVKEGETI